MKTLEGGWHPPQSQRTAPQRVLILGSGALKIGQAGEFDYSGSQAIKALKEEGIYTVLINPNIATVQTSEGYASRVYFLPIRADFVEKVMIQEQVDSVLLAFGGQDALNCGLELERNGALKRHGVRVLGTPAAVIRATEDRQEFNEKLSEIGVKTARSRAVTTVEDALNAALEIGYPVMLRAGFALGGKGSGVVSDPTSCRDLATRAFAGAPQVLVEECLSGWKEIEYEVVRDAADNCITVCNMENFDPMGIHTGESIVVAPSQTLNDDEYQLLRDVAIRTIRHLGVIGECNIQYALDPRSRDYRVIEVNARLSRSSALASKATGYPLAYVAAKIALGYTLPEIPNSITQATTAFFEPALDYVVCKIPRWDLEKFSEVDEHIGTEMKSVGEVMAIGKSFAEAFQKALRMLEIKVDGLDPDHFTATGELHEILRATPRRPFAIAKALEAGTTVQAIAEITGIDPFFLHEIERVMSLRKRLKQLVETVCTARDIPTELLRDLKVAGYSDRAIAKVLRLPEDDIRACRHQRGLRPHLVQIDTLAGEYPAETNYLYFTYAADRSDIGRPTRKAVLVLGSGCYRIGSSVEFDWCCVNAAQTARELGYETILLNCNPETVSTDYDTCDRLVFDEISLETVLELCHSQVPLGVIVSMGGQTPNNLALKLHREGVRIIGTPPRAIDQAEDRQKFSQLLDELHIQQPRWLSETNNEHLAEDVTALGGYPVLVRPSYVLSGAAMRVAYDGTELKEYIESATSLSPDHPVVVTKFELDAREVEYDAVASSGTVTLWAICEHIENAGVHSGDASLICPPQRLYNGTIRKIREIGEKLARAFNITGPFNIQMLARQTEVSVIECNLRASRSFPFVSKVMGVNFITEAARLMLDAPHQPPRIEHPLGLDYVAVKVPQFSFGRLRGADPRLGVEMASTGEVACFGKDPDEALLMAMLSTGFRYPKSGVLIDWADAPGDLRAVTRALLTSGLPLFSPPETARHLREQTIPCHVAELDPGGSGSTNLRDALRTGQIDLAICVPQAGAPGRAGYAVRRTVVDYGVPLLNDSWLARRVLLAMDRYGEDDLSTKAWDTYLVK